VHDHDPHGLSARAVLAALALNLAIFVVEAVGAWLSDSLSLLSDALHNLSDCLTLVLALVATRLAVRHATATHTFGYARSEILVAFVNALTLFGVGAFIAWEAVGRALHPVDVQGPLVVAFGVAGLAANLASTLVLRPHAHDDLNARSAFLHLATDAAESAAVVAGGALMWAGVPLVDPILSGLIGLVTMKGACDVLAEAAHILNEGAPEGGSAEDVTACLRDVAGVCDVHHVHVWSLSSHYHAASAHVVVPDQGIGTSRELIDRMAARLHERCGIDHPTFQLEVGECRDGGEFRGPEPGRGHPRHEP
jgi:cobalt-zinc-cadmium efflux system protein